MISNAGIELSSGLLLGLGESMEDRLKHLHYLNNFKTLGEIPIMGFNPYDETPMANHLNYQALHLLFLKYLLL